jgi:hypothetical protein
MWFWNTLTEYLGAVTLLFIICAGAGILGSFGFQIHRGFLILKRQNTKSAFLRIGYGLVGCAALVTGFVIFHVPPIAWAVVGGFVIAGFFGYFAFPGDLGE